MFKKSLKSISLVLPVYNEKNLLEPAVRHCIKVLSQNFEDFELILVDDGSTDGTGEVMDKLAESDKRIHVLHNYINLNIGISVPRGMATATKDYITWNAVDLPLAIEDIAGLMQYINDCDVLVQERKTYSGYTLWRLITSKINRVLLRILFRCGDIRDMNFTQIYRREIINKIFPLSKSPAFFTPEMILRAKKIGLRVKSIDVEYHPRPVGQGAFGKPHDILWSMYDMFRFRFNVWGKLKKRSI
jgi:glycosyltransferase involved in cell wall biosynthesis